MYPTMLVYLWIHYLINYMTQELNRGLSLTVYSPQEAGGLATAWTADGLGHGKKSIEFFSVTDGSGAGGKVLETWSDDGHMAMAVYAPQPDGSYSAQWASRNMGQGAGSLQLMSISMDGDGHTQIVQLWNNAGKLGFIVYSPQPDGSFKVSWANGDMGQGASNIGFFPVTMNGDGRTQIVQLWNNAGKLGFIVYSPQPDGSFKVSWANGDMGQGAGNMGFVPILDGRDCTTLVQVWDNVDRLAFVAYSPQPDGSYKVSWASGDMGRPAGTLAFLPLPDATGRKSSILHVARFEPSAALVTVDPNQRAMKIKSPVVRKQFLDFIKLKTNQQGPRDPDPPTAKVVAGTVNLTASPSMPISASCDVRLEVFTSGLGESFVFDLYKDGAAIDSQFSGGPNWSWTITSQAWGSGTYDVSVEHWVYDWQYQVWKVHYATSNAVQVAFTAHGGALHHIRFRASGDSPEVETLVVQGGGEHKTEAIFVYLDAPAAPCTPEGTKVSLSVEGTQKARILGSGYFHIPPGKSSGGLSWFLATKDVKKRHKGNIVVRIGDQIGYGNIEITP
jgi:hypothetical protein